MVGLNLARLDDLYAQLGEAGAEDVVCRALEELALRLSHTEQCHRDARLGEMRKSARSLVAIADQIGMLSLSRVASDVTIAADSSDSVAIAATLSRLLRIGESSLCEVWEMRNMSI